MYLNVCVIVRARTLAYRVMYATLNHPRLRNFKPSRDATDIPISFTNDGRITHIQLDGNIKTDQLKEAIKLAKKACEKIHDVQKKALKETIEE